MSDAGESVERGVIYYPHPITDTQARRIKRMWLRSNRGYVRLYRHVRGYFGSAAGAS